MIYKVVLKNGYYENWFDFECGEDAINFAETALKHFSSNEDNPNHKMLIIIRIIDEVNKKEED